MQTLNAEVALTSKTMYQTCDWAQMSEFAKSKNCDMTALCVAKNMNRKQKEKWRDSVFKGCDTVLLPGDPLDRTYIARERLRAKLSRV